MDFLDIVMELRKRHKIEVPEEDYMQLATLDGCRLSSAQVRGDRQQGRLKLAAERSLSWAA